MTVEGAGRSRGLAATLVVTLVCAAVYTGMKMAGVARGDGAAPGPPSQTTGNRPHGEARVTR